MNHPVVRKAFDNTLESAKEALQPVYDLVEVAARLDDKYGFGLPEWAEYIYKMSLLEPSDGSPEEYLQGHEETGHADFPHPIPFRKQLLYVLDKLGGTGSNKEVLEGWNRLSGMEGERTYRQVRHALEKLWEDNKIVKEEPGPGTQNNYWRLPDASPRKLEQQESKAQNNQVSPNGVRKRDLPQDYPKDGTWAEKIKFTIDAAGRFLHRSELEERLSQIEGSISKNTMSYTVSKMYTDGHLARIRCNKSSTLIFYGLDYMVESVDDGPIMLVSNQYAPSTEMVTSDAISVLEIQKSGEYDIRYTGDLIDVVLRRMEPSYPQSQDTTGSLWE